MSIRSARRQPCPASIQINAAMRPH
jgi:hypothetical protein